MHHAHAPTRLLTAAALALILIAGYVSDTDAFGVVVPTTAVVDSWAGGCAHDRWGDSRENGGTVY